MNFEYIKKLPIKIATSEKQKEISETVDRILRLNQEKNLIKEKSERSNILKEIKDLENGIDEKIYDVYGLSKNEINAIEGLD